MKLESVRDTLRVSAIRELGAANANAFRDWVRKNMAETQRNIDIDLSSTTFLDSCGLGALVSLHKTAQSRQGRLRLINPLPPVQQLLELTRLDEIFLVVKPSVDRPLAEVNSNTEGPG